MIRSLVSIYKMLLCGYYTVFYTLMILFFQKKDKTFWVKKWGKKLIKTFNVKIDFEGKTKKEGQFFVFNHLSYLDIPLLWNKIDGIYVSKKEVRKWPIIGLAAYKIGVIFIDRSNKNDIKRVNKLIDKTLKEGKNIFVFAESTSTNGKSIKKFKPPLLDVAVKRNESVRYGVIGYKTDKKAEDASTAVCWWGDMTFFPHLFKLGRLKKVKAKIILGKDEVKNEDRKKLAEELWDKASELHKKEILED